MVNKDFQLIKIQYANQSMLSRPCRRQRYQWWYRR